MCMVKPRTQKHTIIVQLKNQENRVNYSFIFNMIRNFQTKSDYPKDKQNATNSVPKYSNSKYTVDKLGVTFSKCLLRNDR